MCLLCVHSRWYRVESNDEFFGRARAEEVVCQNVGSGREIACGCQELVTSGIESRSSVRESGLARSGPSNFFQFLRTTFVTFTELKLSRKLTRVESRVTIPSCQGHDLRHGSADVNSRRKVRQLDKFSTTRRHTFRQAIDGQVRSYRTTRLFKFR